MTDTKQDEKQQQPKFLWIFNNRDGGLILTHRPLPKVAGAGLALGKIHVVPPGASLIPVAFLEQWKQEDPEEARRLFHTAIPSTDPVRTRRHERAGQPHLVEGPLVADPRSPLEGLTEGDAISVASEIIDLPLLERLAKVERRASVAVALQAACDRYRRDEALGGRTA